MIDADLKKKQQKPSGERLSRAGSTAAKVFQQNESSDKNDNINKYKQQQDQQQQQQQQQQEQEAQQHVQVMDAGPAEKPAYVLRHPPAGVETNAVYPLRRFDPVAWESCPQKAMSKQAPMCGHAHRKRKELRIEPPLPGGRRLRRSARKWMQSGSVREAVAARQKVLAEVSAARARRRLAQSVKTGPEGKLAASGQKRAAPAAASPQVDHMLKVPVRDADGRIFGFLRMSADILKTKPDHTSLHLSSKDLNKLCHLENGNTSNVLEALQRAGAAAISPVSMEPNLAREIRECVIDADATPTEGKPENEVVDAMVWPSPPLPPPNTPPTMESAGEVSGLAVEVEPDEVIAVSQCSKRRRGRRVVGDEDDDGMVAEVHADAEIPPQGDAAAIVPSTSSEKGTAALTQRRELQTTDMALWIRTISTTCTRGAGPLAALSQGGNTCFISCGLHLLYHSSAWDAYRLRRVCECMRQTCRTNS